MKRYAFTEKAFGLIGVSLLASLGIVGAVCLMLGLPNESALSSFLIFYQENMREPFFGAYLTLAGFLYSLKTFILIEMKKNVYEHPEYVEIFKKTKKINSSVTFYGPLSRLSDLLYYSVIFAMIASASQFSVGLISHWSAAAACCYLATVSLIILAISLYLIKQNLNYWLIFSEKRRVESSDSSIQGTTLE